MEKDKLIVEYTRLCLEFQSFAGPDPVDEEREDQVINRLYEIRELLGLEPFDLRSKKINRKITYEEMNWKNHIVDRFTKVN